MVQKEFEDLVEITIDVVSREYGYTPRHILSRRHKPVIWEMRALCAYIIRETTPFSVEEVAYYLRRTELAIRNLLRKINGDKVLTNEAKRLITIVYIELNKRENSK